MAVAAVAGLIVRVLLPLAEPVAAVLGAIPLRPGRQERQVQAGAEAGLETGQVQRREPVAMEDPASSS